MTLSRLPGMDGQAPGQRSHGTASSAAQPASRGTDNLAAQAGSHHRGGRRLSRMATNALRTVPAQGFRATAAAAAASVAALPGQVLANVPQDPNQRRVLFAALADALGTGLFLPISVIYLTRIVGLAAAQVGLGLTIAGLIAVVAGPCAGPLLDRYDARKIVLACFAASALGFLAYLTVDSLLKFIVVAIVIQFASRMDRPAKAVLTLGVVPAKDRTVALAWQQAIRNLGYGVGGLLAGLALLIPGRTPFEVLLAANAASYVLAGLLVVQLPPIRPPAAKLGTRQPGYLHVLHDRPYLRLAGLNAVVCLHDSVLVVAMPLWVILRTAAPLSMPGILFALNTVLIVLLQVRVTRGITRARGITRSYRAAAIGFGLSGACFAVTAGSGRLMAIVLLVVAVTALTIGELEVTAGEQFLSTELAPELFRGSYLSIYKTSMSVQQAVGPVLVTAVLIDLGRAGWAVIALILVAGSLASQRLGARQTDRRLPEAATEQA
jgi:MFS family permease